MLTKREYKELYLLHHKKAESGNVESQFKLGEYYEHGNGVVKDFNLAEFWYRKAADAKHPMALLNLNWMRLKALGVEQNEGHLNNSFIDRSYQRSSLIRSSGSSVKNEEIEMTACSLDFLRVGKPIPHCFD